MSNEYQKYEPEFSEEDAKKFAKRSVRKKQKERFLRKKRKKKKTLKTFLKILIFFALILIGYKFVTLKGWYLNHNAFKEPNEDIVQIVNNHIVSTDIIQDSIKNVKVPNLPIFLMRVKPIKKEIFKSPVIKNVYVRRYGFPARLLIIVKERTPLLVIKKDLTKDPVAFFTSDGILIVNGKYMHNSESDKTLKVLVKDFNPKKYWTFEKVQYIRKIAKAIETYSSEPVEYVDLRNTNDVYVKIKSTNIRLGGLDNSVFERIKRLYTILPQIGNIGSNIKYVDISWDKVNYLKLQQEKETSHKKDNEF